MSAIVALRGSGLILAMAIAAMTIALGSAENLAWAQAAVGATDRPNDSSGAPASAARRHYEEGTKAFNLGEFARAIAEFKSAYNAKPDPLLLYNIAQSYRLAGDASQAVFFYRSYLRNLPGATNRREVESHLRKLEKQLDQPKRESVTPLSSPLPSVPPPASAPASASAAASVSGLPPAAAVAAPVPPSALSSIPTSGRSPAPAAPSTVSGAGVPTVKSPALSPPGASYPEPAPRQELAWPLPGTTPPARTEVDLVTPSPKQEEARPVYKKWWFWAGAAGAIVILGGLGGLAAASARKGPSTTLGKYDPSFTM